MGKTFSTCARVDISAFAILDEVARSTIMVMLMVFLTRVNVGGVNDFAAGPLYGFTILLFQIVKTVLRLFQTYIYKIS